jgi:hypothetical protein
MGNQGERRGEVGYMQIGNAEERVSPVAISKGA